MANNERGRTPRGRDEVITAAEMRDDGTTGIIDERPVAARREVVEERPVVERPVVTPPPRRSSGNMGWLWGLLGLAALVLLGLLLWALFAGDEAEVPVIGAREFPAIVAGEAGAIGADNLVQVRGVVRIFRIADIEREIGADLDDNLYRDWEGKPVVIATEVDRVVTRPQFDPGFANARLVTIDRLTEEPNLFAGQRVVLTGEVEELLGARGFVLTED